MGDRADLLEATLDSLPEGIALLGEDCHVVFWNHAARAITGFPSLDLVGRVVPDGLKPLLERCDTRAGSGAGTEGDPMPEPGRGFLVHVQHKLGHEVSAMARLLVLRDGLGTRIGAAVQFHPAECVDALPHGESGEDQGVGASQADLTDRLESLYQDFIEGGVPFGVLWITVDQAHALRKTHGDGACEAMIAKVEHTLAHGLRPGEHLGRWGEDEFLLISHERTPAMLADHAQVLAGQARTSDFRWWGDRVSLTVSIGAAQAENGSSLANLLERARAAMHASLHGGGNQITRAPEGHSCSPS
jgi:diguanylate cyclase (GGDEF)-like protein/PAS domain S-box-containing protein